jgi:hypothetical protein
MKTGELHIVFFIVLVAIGVVLGNWVYKKLNLG